MHQETETQPGQLTALSGELLVALFNKQLERLMGSVALKSGAIPESHIAGLRRAILSSRTLIFEPGELPLLVALPPATAPYAGQMEALSNRERTGALLIEGNLVPADKDFAPRLPYVYLGVDMRSRGISPDQAKAAIELNHRRGLTAEGLIALARERRLPTTYELMCFGTCFGQGDPVVLRFDDEPMLGKRLALTFVSRRSDYARQTAFRHPSAQRVIAL